MAVGDPAVGAPVAPDLGIEMGSLELVEDPVDTSPRALSQDSASLEKFDRVSSRLAMILIVGNTIVLTMDRYPIECGEARRLELANFMFSILFACELVIKLGVLGMRRCALAIPNHSFAAP